MIDQAFTDRLGGSEWTVFEARTVLPGLVETSTVEEQKLAAEHFLALCDYLDQLQGGEFDRLLPAAEREALTEQVRLISTQRATSDPTVGDEQVRLLDHPVNSALTLAEGRALAPRLTGVDGWPADLGRAMVALYAYLDEIHGGTGRFTELLTVSERMQAAGSRNPVGSAG